MTDTTKTSGVSRDVNTSTGSYRECVVRLLDLSERDPATFEKLVEGDDDGIEEQLVADMQRVRSRLYD